MSVQHNTYAMWGVILPYGAVTDGDEAYDRAGPYLDSAFDGKVNQRDDMTVLFDGMNGRYIAVGHVIAKSEVYQGLGKPVSFNQRPKRKWKEGLMSAMQQLGVDAPAAPAWHVLTHYR